MAKLTGIDYEDQPIDVLRDIYNGLQLVFDQAQDEEFAAGRLSTITEVSTPSQRLSYQLDRLDDVIVRLRVALGLPRIDSDGEDEITEVGREAEHAEDKAAELADDKATDEDADRAADEGMIDREEEQLIRAEDARMNADPDDSEDE